MSLRGVSVAVTGMALMLALMAGYAGMNGDATQQRDRLRDGSCRVAADCIRQRDQLRDGSCKVAAIQLRQRDQLRDGSCQA